jgi:UDP-N-acetylmuramoyl-tripeptide--D-alanyl-D-alanine ligase
VLAAVASARPVLWHSHEVLDLTGGKPAGGERPWDATGISYRLDRVQRGDLFVATKTDEVDHHRFVGRALAAGAVAALVSRIPGDLPPGGSLVVVVDDTIKALGSLASAARARCAARIAAITGSVGKTFTKDAAASALRRQGPTAATEKNDNDTRGALISLARTPRDARYAVYELSMLGPNSVRRKSERVRPHVGLVTTVGSAHLGYHESVEALADAKAKVFAGLCENGVAVLNRDDRFFARLEKTARSHGAERVITFGAHPGSNVRLLRSAPQGGGGFAVSAEILGKRTDYLLGTTGGHHVVNSLGVLALVEALGADARAAAATFRDLRETPGRGNRYQLRRNGASLQVLDFSRSAEPLSVRAALESLDAVSVERGGRRLAVLGDMLALGESSADIHAALAADVVSSRADSVFAAGQEMRNLYEVLPATRRGAHAATAEDLLPVVLSEVRPGDAVLVVGGRLMRMYRIVRALVREEYRPW